MKDEKVIDKLMSYRRDIFEFICDEVIGNNLTPKELIGYVNYFVVQLLCTTVDNIKSTKGTPKKMLIEVIINDLRKNILSNFSED